MASYEWRKLELTILSLPLTICHMQIPTYNKIVNVFFWLPCHFSKNSGWRNFTPAQPQSQTVKFSTTIQSFWLRFNHTCRLVWLDAIAVQPMYCLVPIKSKNLTPAQHKNRTNWVLKKGEGIRKEKERLKENTLTSWLLKLKFTSCHY